MDTAGKGERGNVWKWVEDSFSPLPGYAAHTFYDDFSIPCFDAQHQMIVGGSFASTGDGKMTLTQSPRHSLTMTLTHYDTHSL